MTRQKKPAPAEKKVSFETVPSSANLSGGAKREAVLKEYSIHRRNALRLAAAIMRDADASADQKLAAAGILFQATRADLDGMTQKGFDF